MPKEFKILKHDLTCKISKEELVQFSLLLNKGLDTTFMIEICFRCHKNILGKIKRRRKTSFHPDKRKRKLLSDLKNPKGSTAF